MGHILYNHSFSNRARVKYKSRSQTYVAIILIFFRPLQYSVVGTNGIHKIDRINHIILEFKNCHIGSGSSVVQD